MTESQEQTVTPTLPSRADLATSGLTKRNQDFIWQMVQLVEGDESKAALIAEVGAKLLDGQKTGTTARQLFNTPAEALGRKANATEATPAPGYATYGFWPLLVDNAIAFFMMFSFMFGLTLLFSKASQTGSAGAAGITSLILTSLLGGILLRRCHDDVGTKEGRLKDASAIEDFDFSRCLRLVVLGILGLQLLASCYQPIVARLVVPSIRRTCLYRLPLLAC